MKTELKIGNIYKINYIDYNNFNCNYQGDAILVNLNPEGFESYSYPVGEFICVDDTDDQIGYFSESEIEECVKDIDIDDPINYYDFILKLYNKFIL
jgi:hypothetical protein